MKNMIDFYEGNFAENSIENGLDDFFSPSWEGLMVAVNVLVWSFFLLNLLGWL